MIGRELFQYRDYKNKWHVLPWMWVTPIALVGVLGLWAVGVGLYNINLNYERGRCESYGVATQRDTNYVNTAWGSWECFVNVDGTWVLRGQVWANGK